MHAAQRLLARGRRAGTKASYAGKFSLFVRFCTDCQREHGCAPLSYLPASRRTVVCYVAWLRERGGVKESSLNPYISAINQAHADAGLQKPAIGDHLKLVRAGFAAEEGDTADAERRMPVPAAAILDILRLGLSTDDMRVLRDAVAVVVAFAFYARGDTGVLLLRKHVGISARGLTLSVRGKTVPRNVAAPTTREQYDKYDQMVYSWPLFSAGTVTALHISSQQTCIGVCPASSSVLGALRPSISGFSAPSCVSAGTRNPARSGQAILSVKAALQRRTQSECHCSPLWSSVFGVPWPQCSCISLT